MAKIATGDGARWLWRLVAEFHAVASEIFGPKVRRRMDWSAERWPLSLVGFDEGAEDPADGPDPDAWRSDIEN
ncbi:MAG: hypothetical protein EXR71_18550 [Myxococcales bacterium]|nr:hypothetical protein [Myxococcales bacterium]